MDFMLQLEVVNYSAFNKITDRSPGVWLLDISRPKPTRVADLLHICDWFPRVCDLAHLSTNAPQDDDLWRLSTSAPEMHFYIVINLLKSEKIKKLESSIIVETDLFECIIRNHLDIINIV